MREGESGPPVCFVIILRKHIEGVNERALARFTAQARRSVRLRGEVNVVVTTDREMRDLNRCFRGQDKTTDVLSFPALPDRINDFAGDIVISAPVARQNARRLEHAVVSEIKILILHGVLHLAGHDHERDHGEMARKEAHLRKRLRLPGGLIERSSSVSNPFGARQNRGCSEKGGAPTGFRRGRRKR